MCLLLGIAAFYTEESDCVCGTRLYMNRLREQRKFATEQEAYEHCYTLFKRAFYPVRLIDKGVVNMGMDGPKARALEDAVDVTEPKTRSSRPCVRLIGSTGTANQHISRKIRDNSCNPSDGTSLGLPLTLTWDFNDQTCQNTFRRLVGTLKMAQRRARGSIPTAYTGDNVYRHFCSGASNDASPLLHDAGLPEYPGHKNKCLAHDMSSVTDTLMIGSDVLRAFASPSSKGLFVYATLKVFDVDAVSPSSADNQKEERICRQARLECARVGTKYYWRASGLSTEKQPNGKHLSKETKYWLVKHSESSQRIVGRGISVTGSLKEIFVDTSSSYCLARTESDTILAHGDVPLHGSLPNTTECNHIEWHGSVMQMRSGTKQYYNLLALTDDEISPGSTRIECDKCEKQITSVVSPASGGRRLLSNRHARSLLQSTGNAQASTASIASPLITTSEISSNKTVKAADLMEVAVAVSVVAGNTNAKGDESDDSTKAVLLVAFIFVAVICFALVVAFSIWYNCCRRQDGTDDIQMTCSDTLFVDSFVDSSSSKISTIWMNPFFSKPETLSTRGLSSVSQRNGTLKL